MKVLLLGGGQVATAVALSVPGHHQLIKKTRAELDIVEATAVEHCVAELKPDWIINAAAYTAVDLAEDDSALAIAVNDTAVGTLSRAAASCGSRLLHLSTDFVFDGAANRAYTVTDRPNPLSVYGSSKLGGERHVLAGASGIVMRTAWVHGATGKNFVLTMLRLMREREQLSVVCDQIGTPTWAGSIAVAIWACVDSAAPERLYHWTDLGVASWYDFAVAIHDEALARGLLSRRIPINPIPTSDYPTRARRPAFSVLDASATRKQLAVPAYHWRHNLGAMLDELRTA